MNNWEKVKVKDVANTMSGGTPNRSILEFYEHGDIPWLKTGELKKKFIYHTEEMITELAVQKSSAKIVPENSVILAMYGATVGNLSINKIPLTTNQACCSILPKEEKLDGEFLYYYLSKDKEKLIKMAAGGAQPNISQQLIKDYEILIPSLKEQQKIAEILSSVDAAIEKTEQVIAKTEEVKKGLMQQLLTKGIGHTEFKETEIGEIPVEWKICSLEEISIIKGEYGIGASAAEYNPSKPRYLRITDIDDYGYLSDKDIRGFEEDEYEKYLLKMGDLVFARTGNTTGKTYMYRSGDGDLVFAGFLIRFRFDPELCNVAFINYLTQTKYYSDWVNVNSQRSGQPGINSNQYCKFKVALPSISEQIKIVSILDKVEEKITSERTNLEKYAQLKQGLMQQLLTRQVRVKI